MADLHRLDRYPANHILGVLPTEARAHAALAELSRQGIEDWRLHQIRPLSPAEIMDPLAAFTVPDDLLVEYAEALQDGHPVVAIEVTDEEDRTRIGEVLSRAGGQFVRFFGRYFVERLDRRAPAAG
ncbi:MAG: hypothetical protein WD734_05315 [Dehalococcoidia bacterium]